MVSRVFPEKVDYLDSQGIQEKLDSVGLVELLGILGLQELVE